MDVAGNWIATSGKNGTLRIDRYKKANQTLLSSDHHQLVTVCRDGRLRLWNVGLGTVVCKGAWTDAGTAYVCAMATGAMRVLDRDGDPVATRSGAPFVALALSSGRLNVVRLPDLTPVSLAPHDPQHAAPLTALAISPDSDLLAYGTQTGTISVTMLIWKGDRSGNAPSLSPLCVWKRTHTDIHALQFSPDARSLLVAGNDGLPYRCRVAAEPAVEEELAGFNCDPVRCIRTVGGTNEEIETVVAAGKDGHVRIYQKGVR